MGSDRAKKVLKEHMAQAFENLSAFLDTRGIHLASLTQAMDMFACSVIDMPAAAACKNGCAYCCHLRVGVSIPEVVVLFAEIKARADHREFSFLKQNVTRTALKGDVMNEAWWRISRTPCPFLDMETHSLCLVYALRPFSCRAYHSTDREACQSGFDNRQQMQIPCFPLYRAATDMYSSVLIRTMALKGLPSYQVGFVRALQILFEDETAIDQWFQGEDIFLAAKLS